MRITQCYTIFRFFRKPMFKKYGLEKYKDLSKPVVFWGCYKQQFRLIEAFKGFILIIWCGGDSLQLLKRPDIITMLQSRPDIKHIATSSFIEKDLDSVGIPYVSIPVVETDVSDIKPEPLGDDIYIYTSRKMPSKYGRHLYRQVQAILPQYTYHICEVGTHNRVDLLDVYKKCFIGIRTTSHDGFSNTVAELGLMGRKVIWNGRSPNAIPYNSVNSIVGAVNKEYINRHDTDCCMIAKNMSDLLDTPDFLNTEFYE